MEQELVSNDTIYDFTITDIEGNEVSLEEYRDHVMLIVNTASYCGFTPQFEGLENLYRKYRDRKFIIIGFPCNQFGNQDPESNENIRNFCSKNYGVSFLMSSKVDVNGSVAHPLFNFLKSRAPGLLGSGGIKWNFTKFLIDRNGKVHKRFSPYVKPSKISSYIERLL